MALLEVVLESEPLENQRHPSLHEQYFQSYEMCDNQVVAKNKFRQQFGEQNLRELINGGMQPQHQLDHRAMCAVIMWTSATCG